MLTLAHTHTHILLIEEDPGIAQVLCIGLEREGYQVTWKNCGEEEVAYAQKYSPDLIILDVRLPDGSGFDFCRRLRMLKLKQPILMLTVCSDEMDKILGADDYMTKPFSMRELPSRLRAMLRRADGEFSNTNADLRYLGDLVLDRANGQAFRGNENISLTPTEIRLLAYLAQHTGQAMSRAQIFKAVWDVDGALMDEKVVTVHLRCLRAKIELDSSKPQISPPVSGGWTSYIHAAAGAEVAFTLSNGALKVEITNGGTEIWHVQLIQPQVDLINGQAYLETFTAWADESRSINAALTFNSGDYHAYESQIFTLSTEPAAYQFDFTMTEVTDPAARFVIEFGTSDVDVYVDDIVVTEIQ